jgi:hypothetical protein
MTPSVITNQMFGIVLLTALSFANMLVYSEIVNHIQKIFIITSIWCSSAAVICGVLSMYYMVMAEYYSKPMNESNKDNEKSDQSKDKPLDALVSVLHYQIALACTLFLFVFFLLCAAFRVISMAQVYHWNMYIPAALMVIIPFSVISINIIAGCFYSVCE